MHVLPCSHTARQPESHLVGGIMLLPQSARVLYNHIRHCQIRYIHSQLDIKRCVDENRFQWSEAFLTFYNGSS